jgi:hypothetical protein
LRRYYALQFHAFLVENDISAGHYMKVKFRHSHAPESARRQGTIWHLADKSANGVE